jgi:hypothetical protein
MMEKPGNLASVLLARDAAPDQALRARADLDELLFAKGAATAAGFNPRYRAYEHRPAPAAMPESEAAEARPADPPAAPRRDAQPFQSAVIAFGCVALLLSAGLYFGSRSVVPPSVVPPSVVPPAPAALPLPGAALTAVAPQPAPRVAMAPPAPAIELPALSPAPAAAPPAASGTDELVARGVSLLVTGDIVGARLFFERAAEDGDGHAALLAGMTRDPLYLQWAGVHGMRGDPEEAETWYRRARDLGEPDAQSCIDGLTAWRTASAPRPIDTRLTPP